MQRFCRQTSKAAPQAKVINKLLNEKLLQETCAKDDMQYGGAAMIIGTYSLRITKPALKAIEAEDVARRRTILPRPIPMKSQSPICPLRPSRAKRPQPRQAIGRKEDRCRFR